MTGSADSDIAKTDTHPLPTASSTRHMHRQLEGPSADPALRPPASALLTKFVAAGFPPDTIDFVVCTHLHRRSRGSVWIGERCVITGDVLHHPIQCRHPEWTASGAPIPTRPERPPEHLWCLLL
jgi:glyoxylase-like metal-dependent hydrolase (beta-lactamase superfamily II)